MCMITVEEERFYSLRVRTHRGVKWRYAPFGGCFKTKEEALHAAARRFGSLPYEYRIENKINGEITTGTVNWPGKKQRTETRRKRISRTGNGAKGRGENDDETGSG